MKIIQTLTIGMIAVLFFAMCVAVGLRMDPNQKGTSTYNVMSGTWVSTVKHDGHLWIDNGRGLAHHPDCPCHKKGDNR